MSVFVEIADTCPVPQDSAQTGALLAAVELGLLDQLRAQVAAVKAQNPVEAKEMRVRLRVVGG